MENQIADRREFYNASATSFNTAIETIPTNIVAGVKSCKERTLFEVVGIERENVSVNSEPHRLRCFDVPPRWRGRPPRSPCSVVQALRPTCVVTLAAGLQGEDDLDGCEVVALPQPMTVDACPRLRVTPA